MFFTYGYKHHTLAKTSQDNNTWQIYGENPIIKYGDGISNIVWNDPVVIKEDGTYKMWLSGGTGKGIKPPVRIYKATSKNGINWTIDPTPLLEPGAPGKWDDEKTSNIW